MASDLEKQIVQLCERQKIVDLQLLIKKTPAIKLMEILEQRIGRCDCNIFWNGLLRGFDDTNDSVDKRFSCVKVFLKQINKVELSYKQTYDLITRLFLDLPGFPSDQLIEIVEYSLDSMKMGDPKCVGWKDLLPEIINILATRSSLPVNGVRLEGVDYRSLIVRNLCTMKWPATVLTPIANMFRDMKLGNEEITTVLTKFNYSFKQLDPIELPPLTFQLFSMCNTAAHIVIPIIALQRYFYKHYYKKLYADMESESTDFDSIDKYSDKELREAEETILHHLNYCTQFKISELQLLTVFRSLLSCHDVILTPFIMSSILSVSRINRDPDNRLSSSAVLPFLRNVIASNEDEKDMLNVSAWCRDTLQTKQVNLEQIFSVLIDQNKEGKDVVTPGLVNLAFMLLRAKNAPKLNALGITFLQKFVRKRFIFGQGIVKNIAEWMILEQDADQYSECLTVLSMTDTFTVSECDRTIRYVLDFFLCIPGLAAMRMMSFILPVIRISHVVRDSFIEVMKKAMYTREPEKCKIGVYGFCMLLKLLTNSNSQRAAGRTGSFLTQQNISGYSLMSQTTLGNRNNPQRHFDMLTLEIIGLLRNCFDQSLEIKNTLYESLSRAIEMNPKLISHILQFIDYHFRSYFEIDEMKCDIRFDKIVRRQDRHENEIEICDNLGMLTNFIVLCIMTLEKHDIECDMTTVKELLDTLMQKVCMKDLEQLDITGTLTQEMNQIALQFVGLIEALINYALWTSKPDNDNVKKLHAMFKHYYKVCDEMKGLVATQSKKTTKKGKGNETESQTQNFTINGTVIKKIVFKPVTASDLPTMERFLRLIHDEYVSFAQSTTTEQLRCDRRLIQHVTGITSTLIETLRNEPAYKQISHSRRCLKNLTDVSKVLYERCIKRLPNMWTDFDMTATYLTADCFRQALITANSVFKRKFDVFLKEVDNEYERNDNSKKIISIIQNTIEVAIKDEDLMSNVDGMKIPVVLFECLEILYDTVSFEDKMCMETYYWIFKFCQTYELKTKELAVANKILFTQRMKTHSGAFFVTIATCLKKIFQSINDDDDDDPQFELKSISVVVAESTLMHLLNVVRKQIDDVDYFLAKLKSLLAKIKITCEDDREQSVQYLRSTEKSICSQLIHITGALIRLTNSCIPLGSMMDTMLKILMDYYNCVTNLTKHFMVRHSCIPMSFQATKFDQLLRVCGKPMASNIYELITYIEGNILEENAKRTKRDPQAEKAKVLKETKFLPKLILRIENFNKFVIQLSKKTQAHLSHYLHIGTVRDFRIKTTELKEAIDQTLTHSSQISDDDTNTDMSENQSDTESAILNEMCGRDENAENVSPDDKQSSSKSVSPQEVVSSTEGVIQEENTSENPSQVLKNLDKLNAKTRKKKPIERTEEEEPAPKKQRTRKSKK